MTKTMMNNSVECFTKEDFTERATFRLHTASRLIQQMSITQLKALDITQAQWRALSGVCIQPGATLQQLTAFAQISQPLMSQAIKTLEDRALVTRKTPLNDKRSSVILVTENGFTLYQKAYSAMMEVDERIINILGEEDTKKFKSLLDAIVVGFE